MISKFWQSSVLSLDFCHLILPTVYGKGENANRLIPYLVRMLSANQEPTLTSGEQTRQYLHARDLARLITILLFEKTLNPGIYNVPAYETTQIKEMVISIYEKMEIGRHPNWNMAKRADETMKYLALDGSKLRAAIPEWQPRISIASSIGEYLSR